MNPAGLRLRARGGTVVPGERWVGPLGDADRRVLTHARAPVLDVGCGPARHTLALVEQGLPALGIDITPLALAVARERGVPVLERCVFDRVPGAGRWATALLLDGNVGIGGDPVALLGRVRTLVRPGGRVLVETDAPGTDRRVDLVRLEVDGEIGPWFGWSRVAADHLDDLAAATGLELRETWSDDGRWFARLDRRAGDTDGPEEVGP